MGGVIGRCSPRYFHSEVRGWLGAGGRVRESMSSGVVPCFPGSNIRPGFRAGCRGFLCRYCLDFFIAGKWRGYKAVLYLLIIFHIAGTMLYCPELLFPVSLLPDKAAQKRAASMI